MFTLNDGPIKKLSGSSINFSKNNINFLKLEEYFQLKVIKPVDIYLYIKDNEILSKIYNNIIPKIVNKNINFYIVPLPFSDLEIWWTDYAENYLKHFYGKHFDEDSYLYMTIKLNNDLTLNMEEEININHNLTLEEKQLVFDIFQSELPYNYKWCGKTSKHMTINYQNNIILLDKMTIEESDIYPSSEIYIEAKVNKKLDESYDINSFDDNPYESSHDFGELWNQIEESSHVVDSGYNYSKNNDTYIIDFILYSIEDLDIINKLKQLKKISFDKFTLRVIDISGILSLNEYEDIEINC